MGPGAWRAALLAFLPAPLLLAAPLTGAQKELLARGARHDKAGWTYLHVEGGPRARGFQHGYLLAREIDRGLKACRLNWTHDTGMAWDWLVAKVGEQFAPRIDPENLAELDGIAEGLAAAGIASSRAELAVYNGWSEFTGSWWPQELSRIKGYPVRIPQRESCSAFIATGSWTSDHGIVMGHNNMTGFQEPLCNVVVDVAPDRGHRILMQGLAGWIHSGSDFFVTDAGLVGTETTLGAFDAYDPGGVPEFSRMRRATQDASSIDEWCAAMKAGNDGGYANAWLLGDIRTGEIARLELGLRHTGFERTRDGWFSGSNIAENLKILRLETTARDTDINRSGVARRLRWKQLLTKSRGRIDLEAAKAFEADHVDMAAGRERPGSRSLCAHFELDEGSDPPYSPEGTMDAKVLDTALARRMAFAARWGSACGMAFDAPAFLEAHPQFEWIRDILPSRPAEPWVVFAAGEKD